MARLVSFLRSLAVVLGFFGLVAFVAWGTWTFMPPESRAVLRDPGSGLRSVERGVRAGPTNPLTALGEWLMEWLGALRDRADVVRAADGTSGGIVPLPAWTSVDSGRYFGATETLWQSRRSRLAGVSWSRVVFFWSEVQPRGPRDWRAHYYLRDDIIRRERANGVELVGLLMGTPPWAAADPRSGVRSVPAGLSLPVDDPRNHWATFVRRMAREYRGRIDTWIVWNEPDIRPADPNAQYHTWAGTPDEYARLVQTAYAAAKQGNPDARIIVGATTYWADVNAGRPLYLDVVLSALQRDATELGGTSPNRPPVDGIALNLYRSPDDLLRVAGVYREVLGRHGLDVPLWLTETNAVPYDDPSQGLGRDQDGLRVTMDQQASFVIQASALGLVAGYERLAVHAMTDRETHDEVWGLLRNDGSLRPAFVAYQTAARYLSGTNRVQFLPRPRSEWRWARDGYVPNWQVYAVVAERSGAVPAAPPTATPPAGVRATSVHTPAGATQRVTVVWNGEGTPLRVAVPRASDDASLLDKYGRLLELERSGDRWVLTLPGATVHSPLDPEGYFYIGGDPLLLVEEQVPAGAPAGAPEVLG